MKYVEIVGDLFGVDSSYQLAHCISADCKMGAGIAVTFTEENPYMREILKKMCPIVGDVLYYNLEGRHGVFNLITKKRYFHKPTREDFNKTIVALRDKMLSYGHKKLAIPYLGSGIDRLDWEVSSDFIKETFKDTDIEILVVQYRG